MIMATGVFRLLGDDVRLRLLRLLTHERLNVSELTAILGVAQSGVSRHLGLLRDAGFVEEQREASFAYYRATEGEQNPTVDALWPVLETQFESSTDGDPFRDDDVRLREVIRLRREHRETHGAAVGERSRQLVPGRSWAAWSRALGLLLPAVTVADLGCGDGHLTLEMAGWALRVVAVDQSSATLSRARRLARRQRMSNISWKKGDIERLPLGDRSVDIAVLSQALHHATDPEQALREAVRVTRPRGRVLVLDLCAHQQQWVQDRLDDRWLGFSPAVLETSMRRAGLTKVRSRSGLAEEPFGVVTAVGTVAPARAKKKR